MFTLSFCLCKNFVNNINVDKDSGRIDWQSNASEDEVFAGANLNDGES